MKTAWMWMLLGLVACHASEPTATRPNVLLIYVDDLNDRVGCYGDSLVQTPHIDRLAASGVRFANSYCQQALCGPSRASTLTGRRPQSLGIHRLNEHFRDRFPEIVTLPQAFRQAGYFTARAGKVFHQGVPDAIAQQSPGADDPLAWDTAIDVPAYELNNNGHFYNATPWRTHKVGTGGAISWLWAEKGDNRHHDYNVATEVIGLMDRAGAQPFFLAAGFIRPHVPLVAPKRFFARYDSVNIPLPPSIPADRADMPEPAYQTWASDFDLSAEDHREAIRAYYACVSFMDEQVGRLLEALEKKGLAENTIVLLMSDHGYQLGEHGLWFKNFLFHESAIAPLIIRVPGQAPRTVESVVELLDVYPTLCELAAIEAPAGLEGQSLRPLLAGDTTGAKDLALVECSRGDRIGKALYTRQWALMDWGEAGTELYDLKADPHQFYNLAGQRPEIESTLQRQLEALR